MITAVTIQCPLCNDPVDKLVYRYHLENERQVIEQIKKSNPSWSEHDGICSRCVDYYHTVVIMEHRLLPDIGPYFPIKSADDFIILPTGLRLDADQRFTGRGVTICFIDSGFYLHPDLMAHRNRIKCIVDLTDDRRAIDYFTKPHDESWHGTMTSVVCAGDGYMSHGLYKGIACDAELVLLKAQGDNGKITTTNIENSLRWITENHQKYNIRIVNISVGADEAISYKQSEVARLAENLIDNGITIIAAVGNDEHGSIKPPANAPRVISIGGIDDENSLTPGHVSLYHSSFGITIDGLTKPELAAHAAWIAAPVLPGTKEKKEAETLYELLHCDDNELKEKLFISCAHTTLDETVYDSNDVTFVRQRIIQRIQAAKYISPAYMHVDGTSFAAPIVSAVVAQMLEANPDLTPSLIREILLSTAIRIKNVAADRQGFGVIRPRNAILKVLKKEPFMKPHLSPHINEQQHTIEFYVQNDCALQISLSGSFNHWAQDVLLMEPGKNGIWKIVIPMLPAGRYPYKFFVDDKMWMEDVDNPYREPDGFNGFNSILIIENTAN